MRDPTPTARRRDAGGRLRAADLTGEWTLTMEGPQGLVNMVLELVQRDNEITGTLDGPMGPLQLAGKIEGNEVSFQARVESRGGAYDLLFSGVVEDDKKITGRMRAGGDVTTEFTAERVEKT